MRFYMIDRVLSYDSWKSIRAQKLTSRNELAGWPGAVGTAASSHQAPTMPSALVLEALCQAGSWLLLLSSELRQRAALLSIGSVTYIREVELGAVLEIEGHVVGAERGQVTGSAQGTIPTAPAKNEMAVFSGRVLVQGVPVLEANEIMCVLIDAQELEDPEDTARMKHLLLQRGKES